MISKQKDDILIKYCVVIIWGVLGTFFFPSSLVLADSQQVREVCEKKKVEQINPEPWPFFDMASHETDKEDCLYQRPRRLLVQFGRDGRSAEPIGRENDKKSVEQFISDQRERDREEKRKTYCKERLQEVIKRNNLRPSRKDYQRALSLCQRGDVRKAAALLKNNGEQQPSKGDSKEKMCKTAIRNFIKKQNLQPDSGTFRKAMAVCQKESLGNAFNVLLESGR